MQGKTDVIVVGAGPVGILNALGLANQGHSVRVLEQEPAIVQSPRAMVYHWSVLDGLEKLGILDEAKRAGFIKQDYSYLIYSTGEKIDFDISILEGKTAHPYNLHLGQNRLAEIGLKRLEHLGIQVHFNTAVVDIAQDDQGVSVTARSDDGVEAYSGSWLIGADGARSFVRKSVGYDFEGMTWPERFVATNIRFDFEKYGYSRGNMLVHHKYGAIIAKIDNTGLWRCTYCEDLSLPEDTVEKRIPDYFREILPPHDQDYELVQYSPYRMHQRVATSMRAGRVLLAGDAAHATNPTGGLGLTSGLFDTYLLYPTLAAVIRGGDDALLDQYALVRKKVFVDKVSPTASENKRFVYHSKDPQRLEQDLKRIRKLQYDEEAQLERNMALKRLESEPLVDDPGVK